MFKKLKKILLYLISFFTIYYFGNELLTNETTQEVILSSKLVLYIILFPWLMLGFKCLIPIIQPFLIWVVKGFLRIVVLVEELVDFLVTLYEVHPPLAIVILATIWAAIWVILYDEEESRYY